MHLVQQRLNRRELLGSFALGLAAGPLLSGQQPTATAGGAPPAGPRSARIKSSVMMWTLKGNFEQQLAKIAEAGAQSVELVTEHLKWTDEEAKRFVTIARSYNLGIDALLCSPDWVRRPVTMVNPNHRAAFLADLKAAIEWSHRLGASQIILMSGNEQPGMTHEAQYSSLVEAAKQAVELAAAAGDVTLILENLNSKVNHKNYFLTSALESLKCVKEVDHPKLRMLFDIYHEGVQHGDPIPAVIEAEPYVAVYHVADEPGRNDPGTGHMRWDDIYKAIGKTSYSGYITLEYLPKGDEVASLRTALEQMRRDLNSVTPAA
jgi:hydroxypyruvate isomerase